MPLLLQKKRKHGGTTTEKLGESSSKTKKVKFKADPKRSTYADEQSTKKKAGGKLKMVEKDGKMVPFYAADGKGKMKEGGAVGKKQQSEKQRKEQKKAKAEKGRGFQKRSQAKDLARFKEEKASGVGRARGRIGSGGGGGGGMGARMMDEVAGGRRLGRLRLAGGGMTKKGYASGGMMKKGYASGGRVSARGDGIARKGKTKGRII